MKRWFGPAAMLLLSAAGAHVAALYFAPSLIMGRALTALQQRGVALHAFTAPQRITPKTQSVVRSSPDLFYALCRYDFSDPGTQVMVRMAAWPEYQSMSLFDARTNNFAVLRGTGKNVEVRLLPPGSAPVQGAIISPTAKGVILIRRLAPNAERFDAAAAASTSDRCQLGPAGAPQA